MNLQESSTKVSLRYDHNKGDRATISSRWLTDKSNLSSEMKRTVKYIIKNWKQSGGVYPIFEPKRRVTYRGEKMMLYVIEIQKREPPTHVVVLVTKTDPMYKVPKSGKPNPQGTLYIFDRIFTDYDEYLHYINRVLQNAK